MATLAPDEPHDFSGETGPANERVVYCVRCLAFGKAVPSHCPGFPFGNAARAAIARKELNYRNGEWLDAKGHSPSIEDLLK